MDKYELAKLVEWAGNLQTRKRMQKVVYLLQSKGCPLEADFFLHHYGPYSTDVARLTDSLVNQSLLCESSIGNAAGRQYEYSLPESSRASLQQFEATPAGAARLQQMQAYEPVARTLLQKSLAELEYASTIAYFKRRGATWDDAFDQACQFKKLDRQSTAAQSALSLARSVMEPPG